MTDVEERDITLADELEPWEQQPNEGHRSYTAFVAYRDLGPKRGLRQIARKVARDGETTIVQPGYASLRHISAWSKAWNWVERAHAWDLHLDLLSRTEQEDARREMARRHSNLATDALAVVARRLVGDRVNGLDPFDPKDLTPGDVIRWLEVSQKLERLARGEPDAITQQQGPGGGPIRIHSTPAVDDAEAIRNMQILEDAGLQPAGSAAALAHLLGIPGPVVASPDVDESDDATA